MMDPPTIEIEEPEPRRRHYEVECTPDISITFSRRFNGDCEVDRRSGDTPILMHIDGVPNNIQVEDTDLPRNYNYFFSHDGNTGSVIIYSHYFYEGNFIENSG